MGADFLYVFSYRVIGTGSIVMGNRLNAVVRAIDTINMKFTPGKIVRLMNNV